MPTEPMPIEGVILCSMLAGGLVVYLFFRVVYVNPNANAFLKLYMILIELRGYRRGIIDAAFRWCDYCEIDARNCFGIWADKKYLQEIQGDIEMFSSLSTWKRQHLDYEECIKDYTLISKLSPRDKQDMFDPPPIEDVVIGIKARKREVEVEERKTGTFN